MKIFIEEEYDGLSIIVNDKRFHINQGDSFEVLVEVFKICCPEATVRYEEVY